MAQLEKFKLPAVLWDSDKEPRQFLVWLENFGTLVRPLFSVHVYPSLCLSYLRI